MQVALRVSPLESGLYAQKGEGAYCENSHLLGVFVRPVEFGAIPTGDEMHLVGKARLGMTHCPECGCEMTGNTHYFESATAPRAAMRGQPSDTPPTDALPVAT